MKQNNFSKSRPFLGLVGLASMIAGLAFIVNITSVINERSRHQIGEPEASRKIVLFASVGFILLFLGRAMRKSARIPNNSRLIDPRRDTEVQEDGTIIDAEESSNRWANGYHG